MTNTFEIRGDVTVIFINYNGRVFETLIDTKDLPIVQSIKGNWRVVCSSVKNDKFYVYGSVHRKRNGDIPPRTIQIALARLLMGFPEGLVVDHINDDSLDNRRSCNLQSITNSENVKKQKKAKGKGIYTLVNRKVVW